MSDEQSDAGFAALVAQSGLKLSTEQIAALRHAYSLFRPILARVAAPLPREAEPAVIFNPEVR